VDLAFVWRWLSMPRVVGLMSPQAWRAADRDPNPPDVSCDLDTTSPREVRHLVRGFLADREGLPVDDAVLVADELVCNAQRHGRSPRVCRLAFTGQGQRVRIEVDDTSPDLVRQRTPDRYGGRGLVLVDQLASAWGVQRYPDHKTVWAELALNDTGRSTHARHLTAVPTPPTAAAPDG
jgi:histidine kinase-like protein